MESSNFGRLNLKDFKWVNEPKEWKVNGDVLEVTTDEEGDYWQGTWYNFYHNSGHIYGVEIRDDFSFTACIEGEYIKLYDQAGLMIYQDEKHWLKAGIEYNDDQPMISSVLTNELSDWGTGVFTGNAKKYYLRVTRKGDVVCVKYSTDNKLWLLLRLCPMNFNGKPCFIGLFCCTPLRKGLKVKFSEMSLSVPAEDILHSN
ncbi:regulation of enolase protein 1-like [Trichoplusia ni]|uniref:Regulation of enolase protein 1-like n=1 Tax=Trichoplusia ni TaxID=7111 RepID=A0A7E5WRP3_TRINI|nr:regulation of enolase protein 1-like [Trichoplusia ni]